MKVILIFLILTLSGFAHWPGWGGVPAKLSGDNIFTGTNTFASTLTVDGQAQAQDLARFINDSDGSVGDSSVYINKLGHLHIGTASGLAGRPLWVADADQSFPVVIERTAASGAVGLQLKNGDGNDVQISHLGDESFKIRTQAVDNVITATNGGLVGIGTATAVNRLNVNGAYNFFADSSSTNDAWGFVTTGVATLTTGMSIYVQIAVVNTDGATLQINALGAKAVEKNHNVALATGDVEVGQILHLVYDGTDFQMLSQLAQ